MNTPPQKSASGLVQFIQTVSLSIRLLRSSKVPLWTKAIPFLGLVYLIFPLDFIPDIIPGLGQLDDLTVLLLCLWAFLQLCPPALVRQMANQPTSGSPHEPKVADDVVDATFRVVKDDEAVTQSTEQIPPTKQP